MVWKNKILCLPFLAVLCLLFCSCGTQEKQTIQFFCMDTVMQITAYGSDTQDALAEARDVIESIATALDAHTQDSALSTLCNGDIIPNFIQYPLNIAKQLSNLTGGALDITMYRLTDAGGFYNKAYTVPNFVDIQQLLHDRGQWKTDGQIYFCTDETKLDLGSLAKGYAASEAVESLKNNGITSAVLSLGGNVQTLGKKPNGSDWTVSVTDPLSPDGTVGDLHIGECAVVTSGSYQRFFTDNDKTYHHILDPKTGCPVDNELLSVTVLCADGTMADGLSTALFVLGTEKTAQLYKNSDISFEAILITKEKEIILTQGLLPLFEQTNETYTHAEILS